jgi:hypothetical protein
MLAIWAVLKLIVLMPRITGISVVLITGIPVLLITAIPVMFTLIINGDDLAVGSPETADTGSPLFLTGRITIMVKPVRSAFDSTSVILAKPPARQSGYVKIGECPPVPLASRLRAGWPDRLI